MIITKPQKQVYLNNYNLQLTYNNEALSVVLCEKIVGVFIDNNLTWKNHTDAVVKKIVSNASERTFQAECNLLRPIDLE